MKNNKEDKEKAASRKTNFGLQVGSAIVNFETSKLNDLSSVRDKTTDLVNTLGTIKEEMQTAATLKASQQGEYQKLLDTIEKLKTDIGSKHFGLLPEDILLLEGILQEVQRKKKEASLREEEAPTPE